MLEIESRASLTLLLPRDEVSMRSTPSSQLELLGCQCHEERRLEIAARYCARNRTASGLATRWNVLDVTVLAALL